MHGKRIAAMNVREKRMELELVIKSLMADRQGMSEMSISSNPFACRTVEKAIGRKIGGMHSNKDYEGIGGVAYLVSPTPEELSPGQVTEAGWSSIRTVGYVETEPPSSDCCCSAVLCEETSTSTVTEPKKKETSL